MQPEPWQPQHEQLLSHLMNGTDCCHAPSGRYCPVGARLRRAYREAFKAEATETNTR